MNNQLSQTMKKICLILSIILLSCGTASPPDFTCDELLPQYSQSDQIINHLAYTLKYNETYEQAEWVMYVLTAEKVSGTVKRTDNFRPDPQVKTGSAALIDYRKSGYDRGHLAPAADLKWSKKAMSESFFMSNMSPQRPGFNRGIWKNLEALVRSWAVGEEEIIIVTGPVLNAGLPVIGSNEVAIPEYYYKVILDYREPGIKGIGFILPNKSSKASIASYAVTIDSVESFTGIDFFPALPDNEEDRIEATVEFSKWKS